MKSPSIKACLWLLYSKANTYQVRDKHKHRRATLPMDRILFPFSNTTSSSFIFLSSAMAFASPAILSILSSSLRYSPNALARLRSRSPYKIQIKKPTDYTA